MIIKPLPDAGIAEAVPTRQVQQLGAALEALHADVAFLVCVCTSCRALSHSCQLSIIQKAASWAERRYLSVNFDDMPMLWPAENTAEMGGLEITVSPSAGDPALAS